MRLLPSPRVEAALRDDYDAMQEMFWRPGPDFQTLLSELRQLESDINNGRLCSRQGLMTAS